MTSVHDCDMITQMKAPAVTSPGPGPDSRGSRQEVRRFNCNASIHEGGDGRYPLMPGDTIVGP